MWSIKESKRDADRWEFREAVAINAIIKLPFAFTSVIGWGGVHRVFLQSFIYEDCWAIFRFFYYQSRRNKAHSRETASIFARSVLGAVVGAFEFAWFRKSMDRNSVESFSLTTFFNLEGQFRSRRDAKRVDETSDRAISRDLQILIYKIRSDTKVGKIRHWMVSRFSKIVQIENLLWFTGSPIGIFLYEILPCCSTRIVSIRIHLWLVPVAVCVFYSR